MDSIEDIIIRKLTSSLSEDDARNLELWQKDNPKRQDFLKRVCDYAALDNEYAQFRRVKWERPAANMMSLIEKKEKAERRLKFTKYSIAASVVLAIGICGWLLFSISGTKIDDNMPMLVAESNAPAVPVPGQFGAVIKDSRGDYAPLTVSDTLRTTGKMLSGYSLAKHGKNNIVTPPVDLSIEVARGREFKVILEDSTVVWLNSQTTLYYPEHFDGVSRRVSVSGEAYFEVKPDPERPFYVVTDKQTVKVYGTTFNIRGYDDEESIFTTLEWGSVSVSKTGHEDTELHLTPGHQSKFVRDDARVSVRPVNTDLVTGWIHGKFVFENTPLATIMQDLSRWYNFEYEFTDASLKSIVYMGAVSRYADFRTVVAVLESSGEVKFTVTGDKVTISKK